MTTNAPPRCEARVTLVDASGVARNVNLAQIQLKRTVKSLVWLDVCGAEAMFARAYLKAFDASDAEIVARRGVAMLIGVATHGVCLRRRG